MITLLHASDLHFGKTDPVLVECLREEIKQQKPTLVIISGDFTQDGRTWEFIEASRYIRSLEVPVFAVPGNHDMPRFSLLERFRHPYKRYKEHIGEVVDPVYESPDCLIVGINTARPIVPHWNWAHGMVSEAQIRHAEALFANAKPGQARILVCHHPLMAAVDAPMDTIFWRGQELAKMLVRQKVELILTGHVHHASVTITKDDHSQIASVGASTATSTRLREHANGYNRIRITEEEICIDLMHWEDGRFVELQRHTLKRGHFAGQG